MLCYSQTSLNKLTWETESRMRVSISASSTRSSSERPAMVPSSSAIGSGKGPSAQGTDVGAGQHVLFFFLPDQTYHQVHVQDCKSAAVNQRDPAPRTVHPVVDLAPRALAVSQSTKDPSNRNAAHPIRAPRHHRSESMPKTNKIRTHFLKNCDLPSLLEPAPAHEATWTATKGT